MRIIIPMAGAGKRMRPHTLTIPKPLINVAGKPIVQRLVEDIVAVCNQKVEEIAYIIHPNFGSKAEQDLIDTAHKLGAKGTIHYQTEALGTAHAILCAKTALVGNVVVAFADTLFVADFKLDTTKDGIIWVNKIEDPRQFGVVKLDNDGFITEFHEKPTEFISDLAIIGIYYFKDGNNLCQELQYLIDHNITEKGEYQLTNAMENMKNKGMRFSTGAVNEWLDCGNKNATVHTNGRVLTHLKQQGKTLIDGTLKTTNSTISDTAFIGAGVQIENSTIGQNVSIGSGSVVKNSTITNSIIQANAHITNATIHNSMIGQNATIVDASGQMSISDYSTIGI